jgi:hypothetical protein
LPAAALAAAGLLSTLLACEASEPGPRATQPHPSDPPPSATSTVRPSATPDFSTLTDLGTQIEIGVIGPEHTENMADFVSTGDAVLFSSGAGPDVATTTGAPDLWEVKAWGDPQRVWKNPSRDHTLVRLGGDLGTYAFVDMPLTGQRAWTLYLLPGAGEEAIVLDEHPGDEDVSSLVPSFSIHAGRIVWTAFDRGPDGSVSQMLMAAEPDWEPRVILEYPAAEAEVWLPSLYGAAMTYSEVRYSEDGLTDERSVWLMSLDDPAPPRRLDTTGRATMPVMLADAVLWKQTERGYNMFNWGHMYRHDIATERVSLVDITPQTFVNYPSGGQRYAVWRGADSFQFGVYDHVLDEPRLIESNPTGSDTSVLAPHIHESLLVWLRVVGSDADAVAELRYAAMPDAGEARSERER